MSNESEFVRLVDVSRNGDVDTWMPIRKRTCHFFEEDIEYLAYDMQYMIDKYSAS